jgi:hypothetical protein
MPQPHKTIVEFLLSGVTRMHPRERTEAFSAMLAGLLPEMSRDDIAEVRQQVEARCWITPGMTETMLELIDGHLALREIMAGPDEVDVENEGRGADRPDYEV